MKKSHRDKIKTAIKNRALLPTLYQAIRTRIPFQTVKNSYILDLQLQNKVARSLKRDYSKAFSDGITLASQDKEGKFQKTIWWCWLQGIDQAPALVKSCYESLKKNMPDYDIKVITYHNIKDYISLPEYIEEKHRKGIISATHYSDIVRIELLYQYGGIWADATVLCTGGGGKIYNRKQFSLCIPRYDFSRHRSFNLVYFRKATQ